MSNFSLAGKAAAVTGANSGIGQALALALAGAGAQVVCMSRTRPEQTEAQFSAIGAKLIWVDTDFTHVAGQQGAFARADAASGGIDILINNAGTIRRTPALEFSETDWDEVISLNLKSVFFLSQCFAQHFLKRKAEKALTHQGKIIQIASMLSFQGGQRVASYTASKSGVVGVTRILANEWAALGINVNAIAPGYIETSNTEPLRADANRNRDILARIPAGRWGRGDDLGGAAVFLSSAAADYVHGTVLPVDGGWLAR